VATPDETTSLFVYGSLVDETHRAEIIGRRVEAIAATLNDYERGRARHYYIRQRPGGSTPGLLLLNLDARDFATLDRYEEIPVLYTRAKITVAIANGADARCWIYLPTPATLGLLDRD
jgi:gamma-glutamylcyclotransferase (GGCT)/AIG2-like uncharacterized protein YtfP